MCGAQSWALTQVLTLCDFENVTPLLISFLSSVHALYQFTKAFSRFEILLFSSLAYDPVKCVQRGTSITLMEFHKSHPCLFQMLSPSSNSIFRALIALRFAPWGPLTPNMVGKGGRE